MPDANAVLACSQLSRAIRFLIVGENIIASANAKASSSEEMKGAVVILASVLCSCAAAPVYTRFESSPPGARIEINNEYVGRTPLVYKWPSNQYSHFGNFADETSIRAYPSGPGQYQQRKYFESHRRDLPKIPAVIYFDMSSPDIGKPESE